MNSKIGDRYRHRSNGLTHEVTVVDENRCRFKCVDVGTTKNWKINESPNWYISDIWIEENWEYLGNFGKSNNFKDIYDILNGV